ncbi:unnamed protein product [Anisakis simplex]|uniref:Uncharacterized protein n=1 Tax=Anisakis simplex TaxID=6269 RepID=A0A0M3JWA9_ANISI|nr:unnamed protein product [Anisakis simplex]
MKRQSSTKRTEERKDREALKFAGNEATDGTHKLNLSFKVMQCSRSADWPTEQIRIQTDLHLDCIEKREASKQHHIEVQIERKLQVGTTPKIDDLHTIRIIYDSECSVARLAMLSLSVAYAC